MHQCFFAKNALKQFPPFPPARMHKKKEKNESKRNMLDYHATG